MRRLHQAAMRNRLGFTAALAALFVLAGIGAGGTAAATYLDFDLGGPTAQIDSQPASPSSSQSATFAFSAAAEGSTFTCSLDGAEFAPCTSPTTYDGPLEDGSHQFQVQATDALGNAGPVTVTGWTIESISPPVVIAETPADPATGVSVLAKPTATFSRSMDPATVATSFTVAPIGGLPVAADVSYDELAKTATLRPRAQLASSTTYRVQLTGGAKAEGDLTPLESAVAWTFTTTGLPEAKSVSPGPGATGVSPLTNVAVSFTRAMDPWSFTTTNFSLWRPNGTQVSASPSYDATKRTAYLTPTLPLNYSTTYTVRLIGARSAEGVPLAPMTWSFTTTGTMISRRINAGATSDYVSRNGDVWEADSLVFVRGGLAESFPGRAISGTYEDELFRDHRRASSSTASWLYNIPMPNGTYRVNLYFVELTKWARGQRVFSVDIMDTPAYPDVYNLDIYKEVGANAAYVRSFDVTIADSNLTVRSLAYIDLPEIAAIEIVPRS